MRREGWPQNPRSYVQPNVLPKTDRRPTSGRPPAPHVHTIEELVFFGRMETRKGIILFIQAVNTLLSSAGQSLQGGTQRIKRVTFLGRTGLVLGMLGSQYVQNLARQWTSIQWRIIDNMGPEEAKAYLSEEGMHRLAVIPSRIENSPYTVIECAERQIPFIASRVGGIPDLIHPDDHQKALFYPVVDSLVAKIVDVLVHGIAPARPRVNAEENEKQWISWHTSMANRLSSASSMEHNQLALNKKETETDTGAQDGAEHEEKPLTLTKEPFVSVVLTLRHPVHPVGDHVLALSLESLRDQSFPREDMEVIVVDASLRGGHKDYQKQHNNSFMDEVAQFLEQQQLYPGNWKFLRDEHFMSVAASRNHAVKHAKVGVIVAIHWSSPASSHDSAWGAYTLVRDIRIIDSL